MAQGGQYYGAFGNRTLGQPLQPRANTFGGGIQTSPGGSFLYAGRTNVPSAFATPWRSAIANGIVPVAGATPVAQPMANTAIAPPTAAPNNNSNLANNAAALLTNSEFAPESMIPQANPTPAIAYVAGGQESGINEVIGSAGRGQPFVHSVELSDQMTRIARSKNLLVGQRIDVSLSNHVARIQGVVHTPADGELLINVLALEPDVQHIDNRLLVERTSMPE
jgi:hypothetical protein